MTVVAINFPDTADAQVALFVEKFGTEPGCSFASQNWDYKVFELGPPHLMCDTHHHPADPSVYAFDPGVERGLCDVQQRALLDRVTDDVYTARERKMAENRKAGLPTFLDLPHTTTA